jgi:membrane-associated phospholipid phosphatase
MDALTQAQLSIILALQQFTFLTAPMDWLSRLGYEEFFIALIPILYLGLDANTGARLALVLLLGDSFNWTLKMAFHAPRPYWIDSRVQALHFARDYGLPSGHAQNATGVWLFLASAFAARPGQSATHPERNGVKSKGRGAKGAWAWVAAGAIVFLISLSRVYLGVHFITDVAAGWMFGGLFLFAFLRLEPEGRAWLNRAGFWGQVMAATVVAASIVVVGLLMRGAIAGIPDPESWAKFAAESRRLDSLIVDAGAFFGLGIGLAMARRWARFDAGGPLQARVIRLIAGAVIGGTMWLGLRAIAPREPEAIRLIFRFGSYALPVWGVIFLTPWALLKLNLARARS